MKIRDVQLLQEIKCFIDHNLQREILIKNLCKDYQINRNKLQLGFQHLYGMPVRAYIIHRKMTLAAARLRTTTDPIKVLAIDFGYSSPGNFTKCFKQVYKQSPDTYRKQGADRLQ